MDFYIFEEWLFGVEQRKIIVADPDSVKAVFPGCRLTQIDKFAEGDGRYPAAEETRIKQEIQARRYASGRRGPLFFDFARTERSQDAFISWLIHWAQSCYREVDEPLHRAGATLLDRLFGLHGIVPPAEYQSLKFWPQYKKVLV